MNLEPMAPSAIVAIVVFVGVSGLLLSLFATVHRADIPLLTFLVAPLVWIGILLTGYMCYHVATGKTPSGPLAEALRGVQLAVRGY